MIPNKFAYFSHGSTYRTNKEGENISDNSIVFVGDDQSIATRGKIFGVRGVYPGLEEENEEDQGNTPTKIITTNPLFPLDANGRPLVGTTISVRFRYTNSYKTAGSDMCLNVNGTGAYNIYYNGNDYVSTTTANTTFCGYAGREIVYTFRIDIVNNVERPRWVFVSHGYESGNTNTIGYQLRHNSSTLPASDKFYRYRLLFTSADGTKYVPANTSTSTNATASRTVNQRPIDPFGEILYYDSTSSVSAGSNPDATVLWTEYTLSLGYSFNRTGATLVLSYPAPVYIKCAPNPNSDGSAIIDADTPYVQSLPSTDDGKIYIFLGIAYSATSIELMPTHPVYYYDGTGIRIWIGKNIPSKVSELTNDSGFIDSTALNTALSSKQDKPIEFTNWFSENFGQILEFPTTEETARTLTTEELAAIQDIRTNNYNWETYGIPTVGYWESDAIVYRWVTPFMLGSERSIYCIELKKTNDNKYWIDGVFNNFVFSEDLATVATSGSYNDLNNKPTIPTILTINVTSTTAGAHLAYALENGTSYADIIDVLDNGGEIVLKYEDKIYCLSKRESGSVTFSSLQGDSNSYSSFVIDSMSRVGYYSGTIITSETTLSKGTTTGSGNAVTDIAVDGHQITLTKGETFLKTGDISAWAKASTKPTYTASEVGALPASTHIPADPVNADWNATSGLAEILHKPPIVQSVSVNGGTAISPIDGNVNLEGIVTGIYSGNQGLAPGNDGIITLPEKVIYGSLENGSFYSATYDIITQEWTLSETTTAGMIGKIYIDLYNTDSAMAYVWDGTRFSELSPSLSGFATESYVTNAINALPTPMVFQGTIGTGGTSTTVPSNPTEGDTYKIISGGQSLTFNGITDPIKVGDTVVYKNSTVGWVLIPSGNITSTAITNLTDIL